jgi:hypothetical protein
MSTSRDPQTRRRPAPQPSPPSSGGGLDLLTLIIASASAVVAALVVSHFWGAGTIAATAATPIIVALVRESLARPAQRITEVSARGPTAAARVMGARQEVEGPALVAEEYEPGTGEVGEYRVYGRPRDRTRRAWKIAFLTGLVAFAVAAAAITLPELVAGHSIVGSGHKTTLFRGNSSSTKSSTTTTPKTETTVTTVTQTTTAPTKTETVPAPTQTTPTQTTPPAQTTTTPPPAATAPPAQTTPAPVP